MTSEVEKVPTCPNPVTGAPNAPMGPPALTIAQTSPSAAVIVGWSTKWNSPFSPAPLPLRFAMPGMFAITLKDRPPSVDRAIGNVSSTLKRYARKRFPYLSNERLGSQHASPRLSLFPMSFVVHVCPPSKLTPSSIPAAGKSTFETMTMFWGFVGLTAMASSDSFVCRWLMSMFGGVAGATGLPAPPGTTTREAIRTDERTTVAERPGRITLPLPRAEQPARGYIGACSRATTYYHRCEVSRRRWRAVDRRFGVSPVL